MVYAHYYSIVCTKDKSYYTAFACVCLASGFGLLHIGLRQNPVRFFLYRRIQYKSFNWKISVFKDSFARLGNFFAVAMYGHRWLAMTLASAQVRQRFSFAVMPRMVFFHLRVSVCNGVKKIVKNNELRKAFNSI